MRNWIVEKKLNTETFFVDLLKKRGMENSKENFEPSIFNLLDPMGLLGMSKAIERISYAIKHNESIWIYGDYDVDGISAVSILLLFFKSLDIEANYYIPKRLEEGYGINMDALSFIKNKGGQLIISVDCGISSVKEVDYCNSLEMDIIITDHHQPQEKLPNAYVIINPNLPQCTYENKELSGASVAMKLVHAMIRQWNLVISMDEYFEIAAISTVADIMSLQGENRTIVKLGLESMKNPKNQGISLLLKNLKLNPHTLDSSSIAFNIAPKINSSGRMGRANLGVELFCSKSFNESDRLSKMLIDLNVKRKEIEIEMFQEALIQIEQVGIQNIIVVSSDKWHSGITGIVASKITEKYNRPSIVIAIEKGQIGKGSARSIEGYNIFQEISNLKNFLIKFGGHEQAAGITIEEVQIKSFTDRINENSRGLLTKNLLIPKLEIEFEIEMNQINFDLFNMLNQLEPYGLDNPKPLFILKNQTLQNSRFLGKNKEHFKSELSPEIEMIGFGKSTLFNDLQNHKPMDIVFELGINEFRGNKKLQLLIVDAKQIDENIDKIPVFLNILNELSRDTNIIFQNKTRLKVISKKPAKDKIFDSSIWDSSKKTLFLCQSLDALFSVFEMLHYQNLTYYFGSMSSNEIIDVLIFPNIDKIDFSIYNSTIICGGNAFETDFSGINKQFVFFEERQKEYYIPERSLMVNLYSLIQKKTETYLDIIKLAIFMHSNIFTVILCLEIFREMDYLEFSFSNDYHFVHIVFHKENITQKNNYMETSIIKNINKIIIK